MAACLSGAMLLSLVLVTVTGAVELNDSEMQIFSTVSSRRRAHFKLKLPACKLIQRLFRLHRARMSAVSSRLELFTAFQTQLSRFRVYRISINSIRDLSLHIRQELHRHEDIATAIVNIIARELDLPKGYNAHRELVQWAGRSCGDMQEVLKHSVKMVNLMYAMKYGRDQKVIRLENVSRTTALQRLRAKSPLQREFKAFTINEGF